MNIQHTIQKIVEEMAFDTLEVRVECPLNSGVRVISQAVHQGKTVSVAVPGGVKPFYLFAEKEKKARSELFNVIIFSISSNGDYEVRFSYDDDLQKRVEQEVK